MELLMTTVNMALRALTPRGGLGGVLLAILFIGPGGRLAFAQDARLRIGNLDKLADKAAEVVDVTLDGPMLQLAAKFMSDDRSPEEAQAREIVKKLKGVYVKSFEFDNGGEYSQEDVDLIRAQLRSPGWKKIVNVRSKRDHENDEIYLMGYDPDNIQGMAIISAEPKELTVVNIIGPIDVDKLSALEGNLGIPHMGLHKKGKPHQDKGKDDSDKGAEVAGHDNAE
jgi:hypothetical protein